MLFLLRLVELVLYPIESIFGSHCRFLLRFYAFVAYAILWCINPLGIIAPYAVPLLDSTPVHTRAHTHVRALTGVGLQRLCDAILDAQSPGRRHARQVQCALAAGRRAVGRGHGPRRNRYDVGERHGCQMSFDVGLVLWPCLRFCLAPEKCSSIDLMLSCFYIGA